MENLQLKRYTIKENIGAGGMADVYLAFDNVLKRDCAIKIMKAELSNDPVARIRFRREADAAANLQHPNIVAIYDVGESNNRPFIVMEYILGTTLKALIQQRGAIEKREAVFIATQVVEGLKVAHDAGVIHRDVKPHNILIKGDGTAKITDFGIASVSGSIQLTQHDSVMGSVHYLAPECSRGEQASVQSDLYSLGIVLYEMLTGDLPYKGDAAVQVAMKHMQEDIPSVRNVNNSIEQSIDNIIIKATSKNKLTRYQSAQEMLDDLKVCLSPEHAFDKRIELAQPLDDAGQETRVFNDFNGHQKVTKRSLSTKQKVLFGVIGVALLGLLALLISSILPRQNDNEYFNLSDVSGLTVDEATEKFEAEGLIVRSNHQYETSDEIEKDLIIKSDPVFNTLVKKGDEIRFIVSLGAAFEVENYVGMTLQEVRNKLSSVDFIRLSIEYEESLEHDENIVIRQEGLQEGEHIDPSKQYNLVLVVSKPKVFQLPDVRDENYLEAKETLEALGAKVSFEVLDSKTLTDEEWLETEFEVITKMNPIAGSSYSSSSSTIVVLTYWSKSDRVVVEVDKTHLINRVSEAKQIDTTNKTQESIQSLDIAIQNAENVIANDKATQERVDSALQTLNESIARLTDIGEAPENPVPNTLHAQDTLVTGQSQPNMTIRITDSNGVEIGIGQTNADGSFSISIPNQEVNAVITLVASNQQGISSNPVPLLVLP